MTLWKSLGLVTAMGFLAGIGVVGVMSFTVRLEPGSAGWARLVAGVGPKGNVDRRVVVRLPGIDRRSPAHVFIHFEQGSLARATLAVSMDQGPLYRLPSDRDGTVSITLSRALHPGGCVDILRPQGTFLIRLRSLVVTPTVGFAWGSVLMAIGLTVALTLIFLVWKGSAVATGLGLFTAALLILAHSSAMVFFLFLDNSSSLRLLIIGGFLLGSFEAGRRLDRSKRSFYWLAVAVLIAAVFGSSVRLYFLPSAGSWDVEYWKAWTVRATSHGITRVYGDSGAVPRGHFFPQLRGEEPLWEVQSHDRSFLIDYSLLAMVFWHISEGLSQSLPLSLDPTETRNVAAKLLAVAGDVAIVLILLWLFRDRPCRAAVLAALYWALLISWFSSVVLGFQDQTYAPLVMGAVIAAGRARAVSAGALLVAASMTKLLGVIATPTVAVALLASRAHLWKAIVGALGIFVIVLIPFAVAETLPAMTVQLLRQLVPGNVSSGYPNFWWIYGHLVNAASGVTGSIAGSASRLLLSDAFFAVVRLGTGLFTLAVGWISWRQYRFAGVFPTALAGAAVFLAYATFSVGVFENHPHLAFPLLFATGLWSRRLQLLCGVAMTSYVLNLLLLSGLGRFYTARFMALEPLTYGLSGLRMVAGFDLTLLLAVVNTVVMIILLAILPRELESLQRWEGRRSE